MIRSWFAKGSNPDIAPSGPTLPTVKFDASRVTEAVKADLWTSIQEFEDLPVGEEEAIYEAALRSISKGRALNILSDALIGVEVPKARAAEIAILLNNRATAMMAADRQLALGITEGIWRYSGAPCLSGRPQSDADRRRDQAHKAADGKRYRLAQGLLIEGRLTHPGREPGCKCFSKPIIRGFDD